MTLRKVSESIRKAELESHREFGSVTLIAVSKVQSVEKIKQVLGAGHRDFGENRVQEAQSKWPELRSKYENINLHLLGPLQTNKADQAVRIFDVIHSLDRERLAAKLSSSISKTGKDIEMFVQVNFDDEFQKAGISVNDVDGFVKACTEKYKLKVSGLMCIPPVNKSAEKFFLELKNVAERNGLFKLSMGMSADYEKAIFCGSTHVRVGTAIFGSRK